MAIRRVGDLETDSDIEFTRRAWTVQRIGWSVMALVLGAALLGLFGPGPLSETAAGRPGLRVEYRRFARYDAPLEMRVHLGPAPASGERRLWIDRDYLAAMDVEKVLPEPDRVEAASGRLTYVFEASDAGSLLVAFSLRARDVGTVRGRIGAGEGGEPVELWQLVYP